MPLVRQVLRDANRRAERRNCWSPPARHSPSSRQEPVQEPAWMRGFAIQPLAIQKKARAVARFHAEIIAGHGAVFPIVPPRHGDAFGPFHAGDVMRNATPTELP